MQKTHVREFCNAYSQGVAAKIIGCSQAAVSQMIKNQRDVYIITCADGSYTWEEVRKPKVRRAA